MKTEELDARFTRYCEHFVQKMTYNLGFISGIFSTTPVCEITDGMESPTFIPSSEISVSDSTGKVEDLRPTSETPFVSSASTLSVVYTPTEERPIKEVKLVSTDNIKSFTVKFTAPDGTVTQKQVLSLARIETIYVIFVIFANYEKV